MQRRAFIQLVGGAAAAAAGCASRPVPLVGPITPPPIRAVAFDLFTLFDPRTVVRRIAAVLPGIDATTFADAWKDRLFQYSWLRAAAGRYTAFDRLVLDALDHAARALRITLAPGLRDQLAVTFETLDPWPDARIVLQQLRARRLRLAPLANFTPAMISSVLGSAGLADLFDHQISTDAARTYKPDPRAYALAERAFALPRQQIAFAAFGNWDAVGAAWFGMPTFWVNRFGGLAEDLGASGIATGTDLAALTAWLTTHAETSTS